MEVSLRNRFHACVVPLCGITLFGSYLALFHLLAVQLTHLWHEEVFEFLSDGDDRKE